MASPTGEVEPGSQVRDTRTPVADRIRNRIRKARGRFRANDNIAAYLEAGELEQLRLEVADRIEDVLRALVIDTESDHNTRDTARRVAKMYLMEVFAGRYGAQPPVTEFPNVGRLNELMIVGPIMVRSACSHHLCPIIGRIWVGVMPNEHSALIGLSKYARLVEWVMARPQIQEEAITELANLLQDKMQPDGLAVVMEADHYCMKWRGVKDSDSKMTNSIMRGSFLKNPDLRREFLSLLAGRDEIGRAEMLVRLLYASRSTGPIDEALVASILEKAHAYNAEHGLTGILCTSSEGGVFLQVLEGGRVAVNELYGRILRDSRHREVTLLDYAEIGERRFATWRMGNVNLNRVNLGTILRFSESPILDPFGMSGRAALALLEELMGTAAIVSRDGA